MAFDSQPVARNVEASLGAVPDREGKHATEVFDAIISVFLVQMHNGFGIALGTVAMASGLQVPAQLLVIVDFPIEDDPNTFVFIVDRLMTGLNVDDAEPAHRQADICFGENSVVIRPAVDNLLVHSQQHFAIHSLVPVWREHTADSTHAVDLSA